ncbi:MAG: heavy-metal-associated domain-containing protein [Oscillospiraceae bacterium]|nr:heavy-metal-associated domain-containing protein [Oscillospiraceae bacterium]
MSKTVFIEGMMCGHCKSRVEKALNAIPGVEAAVDLDKKLAELNLSADIDNAVITQAIEKAGYKVTGIQ